MTKEEKIKIFNEIYKDIDGFSLSLSERSKRGINDKSFVYGEIIPEGFCEILEKAHADKYSIFYDLGSGTGKAVILAKLIFDVKKSIGIEYLESLIEASQLAYSRFKDIFNLKDENSIEFIKGDIFDNDFSDGDLVFVNSTCFNDEQLERIVNMSLELKKGSRLIILTKKINDNSNFEMINEGLYPFSWGSATVRIYQRK
ncbi:MAG: methyltransferase [Candidatus Parcubacteria bacterium]|nr:MAG: methyltransferase [Candidatus Parcubacteria bacterium]